MPAFQSKSPSSGETLATYSTQDLALLDERLSQCHQAAKTMADLSFEQRASLFLKVADSLKAESGELARIMTVEMGKPLAQGEAEAKKCAWVCEHYATHAEEMLTSDRVDLGSGQAVIQFQPLGTILAVMPWNFPFWQVFRCAAPIMMGGNTMLLKHAPNVPQCALAIEALFTEAGFPQGALCNIFASVEDIPHLIADRRISGVTLTGSTAAGRSIAATAGHHLKPCLLELGGSDPYIILDDADISQAVEICKASRLLNSGQSCIAAKRFLVHQSISDHFEQALTAAVSDSRVGDPLEPGSDVGPLARPDLADTLRQQVSKSIEAGAKRIFQSARPDGDCFVAIEILTHVKPGMPAWDDELFGPVFALRSFSTDEAAIAMANDSSYGLGAGVISRDSERAQSIANQLVCGNVAINDFVKSDPRYPFGGVKDSGFGRELSDLGIKAFMNAKTVVKPQ